MAILRRFLRRQVPHGRARNVYCTMEALPPARLGRYLRHGARAPLGESAIRPDISTAMPRGVHVKGDYGDLLPASCPLSLIRSRINARNDVLI